MDKQTVASYGWVVIITLVFAVMLGLATPFGDYVGNALVNISQGYKGANDNALNGVNEKQEEWNNKFGNNTENEAPDIFGEKEVTILDGANSSYEQYSGTILSFRSSAKISDFQNVKVNGNIVSSNNYTVTEGSTIVTFKESYLKTLPVGQYSVEIISKTGTASTTFSITPPTKPVYGINDPVLNIKSGALPEGAKYITGGLSFCSYECRAYSSIAYDQYKVCPDCGCSIAQPTYQDSIPSSPAVGDILWYNGYIYAYKTALTPDLDGCPSYSEGWGLTVGVNYSERSTQKATDIVNNSYILESICGKPIVGANMAFYGVTGITETPKMPDTITDLCAAFANCSALVKINEIPANATNLNSAFSDCSSLVDVSNFTVPASATDIGGLFYNCDSLTTVPNLKNAVNITSIDTLFMYCDGLVDASDLYIPSSVTEMNNVFQSCLALKYAPKIPEGVKNMLFAFAYCDALVSVPNIPSSVVSLDHAFSGCDALEDMGHITIGSKVTDLEGIFRNCVNLKYAPDFSKATSATTMKYAFENCAKLQSTVTIPTMVNNLYQTFKGCTSLTNVVTNTTKIIKSSYADSGSCQNCFKDTTQTITLSGSSSSTIKGYLASNGSAPNGNVIY